MQFKEVPDRKPSPKATANIAAPESEEPSHVEPSAGATSTIANIEPYRKQSTTEVKVEQQNDRLSEERKQAELPQPVVADEAAEDEIDESQSKMKVKKYTSSVKDSIDPSVRDTDQVVLTNVAAPFQKQMDE